MTRLLAAVSLGGMPASLGHHAAAAVRNGGEPCRKDVTCHCSDCVGDVCRENDLLNDGGAEPEPRVAVEGRLRRQVD